MRSSSKSRSRNKNRNNRSNLGNVVNRVFDSSGPESKVRGTPQQIIEKYQMLARDAQLSGDRVAAENFLQHAEHYVRMLGEAQREMDQRREQQEAQRQQQNNNNSNNNSNGNQNHNSGQNQEKKQQQHQPAQPEQAVEVASEQPSIPESADLFPGQNDSNLVETPESQPVKAKAAPKKRAPRSKPKAKDPATVEAGSDQPETKAAE